MARTDIESGEMILAIPLRRLLTGVPRTQRARAAIPLIRRYVSRHIPTKWRVASDNIWIDDFLNESIWRRGVQHVGGPVDLVEPEGGGPARVRRNTKVRYGSIIKVLVRFKEEPADSDEPRLEVYLPGYEELEEGKEGEETKEEEEEEEKGKQEAEEAEEEEAQEEEKAPAAHEPPAATEAPAAKESPAPAPAAPSKKESKSAAAKGPAPKAEPKKAAQKPKKEGGD